MLFQQNTYGQMIGKTALSSIPFHSVREKELKENRKDGDEGDRNFIGIADTKNVASKRFKL